MTMTKRERAIRACEEDVLWYATTTDFRPSVTGWVKDEAPKSVIDEFAADLKAWIKTRQKTRKTPKRERR